MKTNKLFSVLVILTLLIAGLPVSGTVQADTLYTTITYDDITLPSTFQTFEMPDTWDMNQGPVVITYTLDLSGAPNVAFNWDWNLMGLIGLFDATNTSGARMAGFLSDWGLPQFPTYPDNDATLDIDDKFNLQRFPNPGSYDETMYDVKCDTNAVVPAFGSGNNYGIWFDRDGVDQWQDDMWGMVNGGTYNTNGVYGVQLTFQKNSASLGTVCPLMFPNLANPWVTGGYGIPTGFYTAWKPTGPDIIPAGLSFASDEAKMGKMHVVVQGASDGGGGAIIIRDLTVTGYLNVDLEAPITSNVMAIPNPAAVNSNVAITANVDDTTTGGSNVASAQFSLDGTNWYPMNAVSAPFDAISEDVTTSFAAPTVPGVYNLCVRGTDVPGNIGNPVCTMFVVYDPSGGFVTGGGWIWSPAEAMSRFGAVWDQNFSTDASGWFGDGITVDSGAAKLLFPGGQFSRFDGYRDVWPGTYTAEIDVYLDPSWPADQGFDYSVASNGSDGQHQRDFIFHVGTVENYGPIVGKELLVAVDNNAYGDTNPFVLTTRPGGYYVVPTAGWYTLQHVFYDAGGYLAVDFNILDLDGNVVWSDTRSDTSDTIPGEAGGNRYALFAHIDVAAGIQVDNHQLFMDIPGPEGKATFGFVSKYKKGATVPDGNTEFQFKAGDLNFSSTSYEWLVVNQAGANAQFKGYGTINGAGNYGFILWAGDGSLDTFRIKIWDAVTEVVVYDNGTNQPIGGGSIVVHKK